MRKILRHTQAVGLKELRENTEQYIRRVQKGDSFVIFRRSQAIFKLSPADEEDGWENVIDFTQINKEGVSAREVMNVLKRMHGTG